MFIWLFFSLLFIIENCHCHAQVKVLRPTGPGSANLQCYEYAYIRFKFLSDDKNKHYGHINVKSFGNSLYDLDLYLIQEHREGKDVVGKKEEFVENILTGAPAITNGVIAYYPWNKGYHGTNYQIFMKIYDKDENQEKNEKKQIESNTIQVAKSPLFSIQTCADDKEVTLSSS